MFYIFEQAGGSTGMTLEETSAKMGVSVADLRKMLGD